MESSKVGYWLQVGANIGILAGLVLVGVQMRQNLELLELQLMHQNADQTQEELLLTLGEDPAEVWAKHILEPENLTLREIRMMDHFYFAVLNKWQDLYELYEKGLVGAGEWRRVVDDQAAPIFKNRFGMTWWKKVREEGVVSNVPRELMLAIQTNLDDASKRGDQAFYEDLQEALTQ
jgi:hypothetical protein